MARKSSFKKGGGRLHGVNGTIQDYQFTDEFNGEPWKAGKIKGTDGKSVEKPHSLNCALTILVDGAEEPTIQNLRVASVFDNWVVSEDGHTISAAEDANLGGSSQFGIFIQSWETAPGGGDVESEDFEVGEFNYETIIGRRVRFAQRDYTAEELAGVKKMGAPEKRKGKDNKFYTRQHLIVEEVYGEDEQAEVAPVKAAKAVKGKATPVKATGKPSKANGKSETTPEQDLDAIAAETLTGILAKNKGTVKKAQLSMKVLNALLPNKALDSPTRERIRKLVVSDDFLGLEAGWSFDTDEQVITLSE